MLSNNTQDFTPLGGLLLDPSPKQDLLTLEAMKVLTSTGQLFDPSYSLTEIGRLIIEHSLKAVKATSGGIILFNQSKGQLERLISVNLPWEVELPLQFEYPLPNCTWFFDLLHHCRPLFLNNLQKHPDSRFTNQLAMAQIQAAACLPLYLGSQKLGLLCINFDRPHFFTPSEEQLLGLIANQAAVAFLNRQLIEREKASRQALESLVNSARLINSQKELKPVLELIVTKVAEITQRPVCSVCLIDETATSMVGLARYGMSAQSQNTVLKVGTGFLGTVASTGQTWHINDFLETEFANLAVRVREGWRSGVGVPLKYNNQVLGVLAVYDFKPGLFTSDEIKFLEGMAEQASVAVHNAATFEQLQRQRDKYQALLENASDGILLLHPQDCRIVEVNLRASELCACPAAQLVGQPVSAIFAAPERSRIEKALQQLSPGQAGSINLEDLKLQTPKPLAPVVSFTARIVEIGDSSLIILIMRDMSERRAMEQQLVRVEQLRVLGQLASGVAHDFNNVLAGIVGLSEILLDAPRESAEERRLVEVIRQTALDGAQMVRRIQYLGGKNQEESYGTIDVNSLIQDVIELTRPRWLTHSRQRGLTLDLQFDPLPVPPVWGNAAELREVLTNLVFNAVDAMPQGGTLALSTSTKADQVWIKVRDTGTGMTEETKQHLFEPFYTTKKREGHGLGLSVSWSIINRHKGFIAVESTLNGGTTFVIKLPAYAADRAASNQVIEASQTDQARGLHTLVVDDDPNLIYVLTRVLTNLGHSVVSASTGQAALAILSTRSHEFEVLFTDLSVPDLPGWDIARAARALSSTMAVVLVTGWGADLDADKVAENGIDTVISKPYRVRDIAEALQLLQQQGRIKS